MSLGKANVSHVQVLMCKFYEHPTYNMRLTHNLFMCIIHT